MKQGTNTHLAVRVKSETLAELDELRFVFRQYLEREGSPLKCSVWKSDGTGDAKTKQGSTNVILIPWTESEKDKFNPDHDFYLDAKGIITGGDDVPFSIVELKMTPTLFERS